MDDSTVKRAYLETLSSEDLAYLAEELGLDLPPDLNRLFVIEEILEATEEQKGDTVEDLEETSIDEAIFQRKEKLPETYNSTFINVLLRDSVWAFVFWEIKKQDKQIYQQTLDFEGYYLKILSIVPGKLDMGDFFIIDIDSSDQSWYVCFPSSKGWFKVELWVKKGKKEYLLASSLPFRIPCAKIPSPGELDSHPFAPILRLSGIEDLHITRSVDQKSHVIQQCKF